MKQSRLSNTSSSLAYTTFVLTHAPIYVYSAEYTLKLDEGVSDWNR